MLLRLYTLTVLLVVSVTLSAQNVGIGTTTPNASALLDISSTTKGVLVPRMTSAQRTGIASPVKGLLVFDTDTNGFWYYNGSAWNNLLTSTEFIRQDGLVRNSTNIAGDNFVFGSTRLDDSTGTTSDNNRFFFNKAKGAFRAGNVTGANWNNDSLGVYSFAAGTDTRAKGEFATAIGQGSSAAGHAATALGAITDASGWVSTALGGETKAPASYATAMGYKTIAGGDYATAMGHINTASGYAATAMGDGNTASGTAATTLGSWGTASGINSLTAGFANIASGSTAAAMGVSTQASGDYSLATGAGTKAPSYAETGIGVYNSNYTPAANGATQWNSSDRLLSVGNGTADNARSNALTVLKNGNIGIGMDNPGSRLDVNGQVVIEQKNFGGNGGLLIKGYSPTFNYPNIGFSVNNTSNTDVVTGMVTGIITGNAPGSEAMDLSFATSQTGQSGLSEKLRVKSNGAIAVSGNTGTSGQVLASNGTAAAPGWVNLNRPYVVHFDLSAEVNMTGSSQTYTTIPGLNNRQFTLSQQSTVVLSYNAALATNAFGKPYGGTSIKIVNGASQTVFDRTVYYNFVTDWYVQSGFQTILVLPAGTYTTNVVIYRSDPLGGELRVASWSETRLMLQVYPE
ncbi:MAG: hypothetical protein QM687_16430 [Ferruginibacter sp.]